MTTIDTEAEPTYATPWQAVHAAAQALSAATQLLKDDACADQADLAAIVFELRQLARHGQELTPFLLIFLAHQVKQGQIVSALHGRSMSPEQFDGSIRTDLITLTTRFGQAAGAAVMAGDTLVLYKHATDLLPVDEIEDPRA